MTLAEKLTGKRLKDLTKDEKKVFYRLRAREKWQSEEFREQQKEIYRNRSEEEKETYRQYKKEYMREYRKKKAKRAKDYEEAFNECYAMLSMCCNKMRIAIPEKDFFIKR